MKKYEIRFNISDKEIKNILIRLIVTEPGVKLYSINNLSLIVSFEYAPRVQDIIKYSLKKGDLSIFSLDDY